MEEIKEIETVTCEECGETIPLADAIEVSGYYYCEDCVKQLIDDGELLVCKDCEKYTFAEDAIDVDGDIYCNECLDRHGVFYCDYCNEYHYRYSDEIWLTDIEQYMCQSCQDRFDYYYCDECGQYFRHDHNGYWDGDEWYCSDCAKGKDMIINDYHTMKYTIPTFHNGDRTKLHMGVEIEMDGNYHDRVDIASEAIRLFNENGNFMNPEDDGSVDVEIITEPATLEYFETLRPKFDEFFDAVSMYGFNNNIYKGSGGHIHVDRKWFEYFHCDWSTIIAKLTYVFYRYYYELIGFSYRPFPTYGSSHHYYRKYNTLPDENNLEYSHDRYYALNLTNNNTIEFRIFGGYHSTEQLFAYLKFSQRLCELVVNTTMEEFKSMTFEELLGTDPEIVSIWNSQKHRFFEFINKYKNTIPSNEYAEYVKEFPEIEEAI